MKLIEARQLFLRHLDADLGPIPEEILRECDEIAEQLGHLALAIDLAGAYISNDTDQRQAVRQYLADYKKHRDDLLQSEQFRGLSSSDKTVWTVWNTTFKKLEKDHARFLPTALLAFLARFKGSTIQDEMFRLASLGMAGVDREFEEDHRLPSDFRQFLTLNGMEWDSFFYRQSRDLLVRYSLAQRVKGEWPGVTIHSLVKWRAMHYKKSERREWWHSTFVLAACHRFPQEFESLRFRRHLLVHVPEVTQAWLDGNKVEAKAKLFMQRTFNRVHYIRQEELYQIHEALSGADGRGIAVLCGMSGIGKTQLAATYAECYSVDYSNIFWLDTKSEDSVKMSYASLANKIVQEHPSASQFGNTTTEGKEDEIMTAVKRWLNHPRNTRWLMICDNFDDPTAEDIHQFLPEANHGSVIILTKSLTVKIGCRIKVRNLDIPDSLEILSNTSLRKTAINGEVFTLRTDTANCSSDPDAAELAKRLDGLPLALAMAGAYISRIEINFADYLRLYEASWLQLQQRSLGVGTYMDRAPMSTLQLSFERIRQESELSAQLLHLWAYFDNQDLWLELLREGSSGGPDWLCQLTEDELSFKQVIRVLLAYGLVEVNKPRESAIESEGYGLHSPVHMWTVHVLNEKWKVELAGLALDCVASYIPVGDSPNSWAIQQRLLRHAARCWSFLQNGMVDGDGRAWALHSLGYLYAQHGKYDDAEKIFQRALHGERALGPDHTSTLDTFNSLGLLYADIGRLQEAEIMYQRALEGYEKELGPDHPSTLSAVNNLGLLYADIGRLHEAETMYQRALEGYEKELGPDHPSTLSAVNNLGLLYADIGRLQEAEIMYQRAMQGYEKELGLDHPSTLTSMDNLASTYRNQGRWGEAEELEVQVMETRKRVLGEEHPSTLTSMANLASTYRKQGRWEDAEALEVEVMETRKKKLGADHPKTLTSMSNLALTYGDQGRWEDAEALEVEVMETRKKKLGADHPSTLTSMNNLAFTWKGQGRDVEATTLMSDCVRLRRRILGASHPYYISSSKTLAEWEAEQVDVGSLTLDG
jgi:tetratricopeptide (TPR) repeat protein